LRYSPCRFMCLVPLGCRFPLVRVNLGRIALFYVYVWCVEPWGVPLSGEMKRKAAMQQSAKSYNLF